MKIGLYLQYAVIAVLTAASIVYMFRRLAPRIASRWQRATASALTKVQHPRAIRALGRWLQPRAATPGGDCGSGCGSCGGCGGDAPEDGAAHTAHHESVLQFHPRRKEERCCP